MLNADEKVVSCTELVACPDGTRAKGQAFESGNETNKKGHANSPEVKGDLNSVRMYGAPSMPQNGNNTFQFCRAQRLVKNERRKK